jgi:hypothetical protein
MNDFQRLERNLMSVISICSPPFPPLQQRFASVLTVVQIAFTMKSPPCFPPNLQTLSVAAFFHT